MIEPFTPTFFRRLQQLKIHTRRAFLGNRQGLHASLRRGHGLEFSDHRLYAPGDDFRHIDWNTYGRTDRLYVRQFTEEQDLNVIVILDTSASMGFPEGENKYEMARNLAIAMGYVALTDGDTVTFCELGRRNLPRYHGPKAIAQATKELIQSRPGGHFDFAAEVRGAVSRQKIPGKCFLISDFLFEEQLQYEVIDILRARNFDISVLQVLAPSELKLSLPQDAITVIDVETQLEVEIELGSESRREYARLLAEHVGTLERYCLKTSISHVLVSSDEPLMDIVLTRLPAVGILR